MRHYHEQSHYTQSCFLLAHPQPMVPCPCLMSLMGKWERGDRDRDTGPARPRAQSHVSFPVRTGPAQAAPASARSFRVKIFKFTLSQPGLPGPATESESGAEREPGTWPSANQRPAGEELTNERPGVRPSDGSFSTFLLATCY